jgi:hypothetical protein
MLKDFILKDNLIIYFEAAVNGTNIRGSYNSPGVKNKSEFDPYSQKSIIVKYDFDTMKERVEYGISNGKDLKEQEFNVYSTSYGLLSSTLIHELQHAYDDFRSGGQTFNTKEFFEYSKTIRNNIASDIGNDIELFKQYINLPHEIWARYSQTMENLHFYTFDFTDDNKIKYIMYDMNHVIKDMGRNFSHFNQLSDEMKKKLIWKTAQFWHYEKDKVDRMNLDKKYTG